MVEQGTPFHLQKRKRRKRKKKIKGTGSGKRKRKTLVVSGNGSGSDRKKRRLRSSRKKIPMGTKAIEKKVAANPQREQHGKPGKTDLGP